MSTTTSTTDVREEIVVHLGTPEDLLAVDPMAPLSAPAGVPDPGDAGRRRAAR